MKRAKFTTNTEDFLPPNIFVQRKVEKEEEKIDEEIEMHGKKKTCPNNSTNKRTSSIKNSL